MITVFICKWYVNDVWLKQLLDENGREVPDEIKEYPESFILRSRVQEYAESWILQSQQLGTIGIITDSDFIIYEFRCLIREGKLDPENFLITEICSEGNGYYLEDYPVDRFGKLEVWPKLLSQMGNYLDRLL